MNISKTYHINIYQHDIPKELLIGDDYTPQEEEQFQTVYQEYHDIFAWSYDEMPRMDPNFISHHIETYLDVKPIR